MIILILKKYKEEVGIGDDVSIAGSNDLHATDDVAVGEKTRNLYRHRDTGNMQFIR